MSKSYVRNTQKLIEQWEAKVEKAKDAGNERLAHHASIRLRCYRKRMNHLVAGIVAEQERKARKINSG